MTDQAEPQGSRSPRKAISLVVAVLLVAWFAFPAGVVDWTSSRCEDGALCAALETITESVNEASRSVGVAPALEAARDWVRAALGIDFY